LKIIDIENKNTTACPEDYPHEVVYHVWQGISFWCDCKTSGGAQKVLLNQECVDGPAD